MPQGRMENAKRNANQRVSKPTSEVRTDLFGSGEQDSMALDWGQVNAEALRATIAGVCRVGGYISFSSGVGGANVKVQASVRGAEGKLWCNNEVQIRDALLKVFNASNVEDSA